jgi:hypothetical protein
MYKGLTEFSKGKHDICMHLSVPLQKQDWKLGVDMGRYYPFSSRAFHFMEAISTMLRHTTTIPMISSGTNSEAYIVMISFHIC